MATTQINIKDRQIVAAYSRYMETQTDDTFVGNGWDVVVEDDGIHAVAEREYSDGIHCMMIDIDWHGLFIQRLVTPDKDIIVKRKWVTRKGESFSDCVIGLSGGYIDNRYGYFRAMGFQEFLDRTGITAISYEDPNGEYSGRHSRDVDYRIEREYARYRLASDGEISVSHRNSHFGREDWVEWQVRDATWAIRDIYDYADNRRRTARILVTQVYPAEQLEGQILQAEWVE